MEKIIESIVLDELGKLRRQEVLYEGEVLILAKRACYEYNMMNVDLSDLLNTIYGRIYENCKGR